MSPSMSQMNTFLLLLALVLSLGTAHGQPTRILTGRLLDDRLEVVPRANIYARDTILIGTTDLEGYFKLDVPVTTTTLHFTAIGYEVTTLKLSRECVNLEVLLLLASTHDFMSVRRVNRQEFKRFKHLPQLYQQAYEKGLFKSRAPCASPFFTNWVPRPANR
ncbi:MAG: hypothetical protein EOO63_06075 [Hymenobacter sp.]|nr:MAG: hypothetical protein EOO63_06075 [Hymenobacter sp.]